MIEYLVLFSLAGAALLFLGIQRFLIKEAEEDLKNPLANCDTSMMDEIKGDVKE